MYFSFFKPQDWRKRSVVRGRGFIQRFLKYADKRIDILKANLLRASFDIRRTRAIFYPKSDRAQTGTAPVTKAPARQA